MVGVLITDGLKAVPASRLGVLGLGLYTLSSKMTLRPDENVLSLSLSFLSSRL